MDGIEICRRHVDSTIDPRHHLANPVEGCQGLDRQVMPQDASSAVLTRAAAPAGNQTRGKLLRDLRCAAPALLYAV
jgi:hypothetical protein